MKAPGVVWGDPCSPLWKGVGLMGGGSCFWNGDLSIWRMLGGWQWSVVAQPAGYVLKTPPVLTSLSTGEFPEAAANRCLLRLRLLGPESLLRLGVRVVLVARPCFALGTCDRLRYPSAMLRAGAGVG